MEFRHRAGEDRGQTPTAAAADATESFGTAAARARDGHGGDGAGHHGAGIGSAAAPASDPDDELRRREAKERIKERILREEAQALQALALEAEVRHELMEERFTLLRSGLARPVPDGRAEESEAKAAPAVGMIADSPSPIIVEPQPQADGSALLPAKRKNPDDAAAGASAETSTVSAATSSKKQRAPDLACTVCGITTTSEAAMQDHLKGKTHRKKTAMLTPPAPVAVAKHGEDEEDVVTNMILLKANGSAASLPPKRDNSDIVAAVSTVPAAGSSKKQKLDLTCKVCGVTSTSEKSLQDHLKGKGHQKKAAALALPSPEPEPAPALEHEEEGDYTPTKFNMATDAGAIYEVMQMNGYVLCKVCDVRTADIVTMQCHLQGSKHTSKYKVQQKQLLEAGNRPVPVPPAAGGSKKSMKGRRAAPPATSNATFVASGELKKVDVSAAAAATFGGSCCDAKTPTHQVHIACAVAPNEVDGPAEVGDATAAMAGEEKSAADVDSSATLQGKEPKVAPPAHGVKIQVESRMCTSVVRQADGTLSCEPCGVHGCDKDGMLQHLYARAHRARVRLAEEKAAPAVANT